MEPRTTNPDGEDALVNAGKEIGVEVRYDTPRQSYAALPKTGEELFASTVQEFGQGAVAGILAGAAVLALLIARRKRHA